MCAVLQAAFPLCHCQRLVHASLEFNVYCWISVLAMLPKFTVVLEKNTVGIMCSNATIQYFSQGVCF